MLLYLERCLPFIGAVLGAWAAWLWLPEWILYLAANGQDISNIFGPIFDLATFSAAALFTIYVIALSKSDGFLGSILKTQTFRKFHRYVGRAIGLSIVLSLWTAGYIVVGFGDMQQRGSLIIPSIWVGLTIWTLLSVGRVVLIFMIMVGERTSNARGRQLGQASRT